MLTDLPPGTSIAKRFAESVSVAAVGLSSRVASANAPLAHLGGLSSAGQLSKLKLASEGGFADSGASLSAFTVFHFGDVLSYSRQARGTPLVR
jgi:hypothetical protein